MILIHLNRCRTACSKLCRARQAISRESYKVPGRCPTEGRETTESLRVWRESRLALKEQCQCSRALSVSVPLRICRGEGAPPRQGGLCNRRKPTSRAASLSLSLCCLSSGAEQGEEPSASLGTLHAGRALGPHRERRCSVLLHGTEVPSFTTKNTLGRGSKLGAVGVQRRDVTLRVTRIVLQACGALGTEVTRRISRSFISTRLSLSSRVLA